MSDPRDDRGRPGHHDPTYRIGGAAPARSALTLRLVLAAFGVAVCAAGVVWALVADLGTGYVVVLGLLGVVAAVDLVVVARRKAQGEPG